MALNALGYDATTLGNHGIRPGTGGTGSGVAQRAGGDCRYLLPTDKPRLPIVVTNVDVGAEPALRGLFAPSVVLERGGERFRGLWAW